jgi:hypothetical protein
MDDRLTRHPGSPLQSIRQALADARDLPPDVEPPDELESLPHRIVDEYPDLKDHELAEALDWVEQASAAQRAAIKRKKPLG